jgi:hypothetical protein
MADAVAIYGAVIGTVGAVGAGFAIYNTAIRDRANIRVRPSFGYPSFGPIPGGPSSEFVLLTASNRGRRPVTLTSGGLLYPDGSTLWFSGQTGTLPKEVGEGQSHSVWGYPDDMIENIKKKGAAPTHAFYWDATGRMHRSRLPRAFRRWITSALTRID